MSILDSLIDLHSIVGILSFTIVFKKGFVFCFQPFQSGMAEKPMCTSTQIPEDEDRVEYIFQIELFILFFNKNVQYQNIDSEN